MGLERRQPNEALRRQRLLRGWSHKKVADLLGTSEVMVGRWEGGKKKTSPFYQEKLCDIFGMTAEELGFMSDSQTTKKEEEVRTDTDRECIHEQQDTSLRSLSSSPSQLIGATLIEPFVTFNTLLLERLSYALARPSSVDETTPGYLETRTQHYWRDRQSAVIASCDLLSHVWDHLGKITVLLEGSLLPTIRIRLCALADEAACIEGQHYPLDETFQVHFDHSLLRSYQGACFRQLYRPDEAQSRIFLDKAQNVLLDALVQLDPTLLQRRPKFLTDLADIYLQQGEIEEACERAVQAATMASQIKLQKVIQRLFRFRQELEPWKDTLSVKKLDSSLISLFVSNRQS